MPLHKQLSEKTAMPQSHCNTKQRHFSLRSLSKTFYNYISLGLLRVHLRG